MLELDRKRTAGTEKLLKVECIMFANQSHNRPLAKIGDHIIGVTTDLFNKLNNTYVRSSRVGPVGATKVLFASIPEVALPVDNLEWKQVFQTEKCEVILSTMANEIIEWEKMVHTPLESLLPHMEITLPAIYNILAMAARDLTKANW